MELNFRSFAYFNETIKEWFAKSGTYGILISASSRDIRSSANIDITPSQKFLFLDVKLPPGEMENFLPKIQAA